MNFSTDSNGVMPDTATAESAAVDPSAEQRVAAAFDDGMVHTSHSGRHQIDEHVGSG